MSEHQRTAFLRIQRAAIRISNRALKTSLLLGIAGAAFVGIFFFALPFPIIVNCGGLDRLAGCAKFAGIRLLAPNEITFSPFTCELSGHW